MGEMTLSESEAGPLALEYPNDIATVDGLLLGLSLARTLDPSLPVPSEGSSASPEATNRRRKHENCHNDDEAESDTQSVDFEHDEEPQIEHGISTEFARSLREANGRARADVCPDEWATELQSQGRLNSLGHVGLNMPTGTVSKRAEFEARHWESWYALQQQRQFLPCPEAPSFFRFLSQLRPSLKGAVECISCRQYVDGEFEPYTTTIQAHFLRRHVPTALAMLDRSPAKAELVGLIDRLYWTPQCRAVTKKLEDDCLERSKIYEEFAAAKRLETGLNFYIPSYETYLLKLKVSCHGNLQCTNLACPESRPLESMEDMESHFVHLHCGPSTTKEDDTGHPAKLRVRDYIGSLKQARPYLRQQCLALLTRADKQKELWDQLSWTEKERLEDIEKERLRSRRAILKDSRQWGTILCLKREFGKLYARFRHDVAFTAERNVLKRFPTKWSKPSAMLELGIRVYKQIRLGKTPTKLVSVFAFVLAALAIDKVLLARDIENVKPISWSDFSVLEQLVTCSRDRDTYRQLILLIWPPELRWASTACLTPEDRMKRKQCEELAQLLEVDDPGLFGGAAAENHMWKDEADTASKMAQTMNEQAIQDVANDLAWQIANRLIDASAKDKAFEFSTFLQDAQQGQSNHRRKRRQHDVLGTLTSTDVPVPEHTTMNVTSANVVIVAQDTGMYRRIHVFIIFFSRQGILCLYLSDERWLWQVHKAPRNVMCLEDVFACAREILQSFGYHQYRAEALVQIVSISTEWLVDLELADRVTDHSMLQTMHDLMGRPSNPSPCRTEDAQEYTATKRRSSSETQSPSKRPVNGRDAKLMATPTSTSSSGTTLPGTGVIRCTALDCSAKFSGPNNVNSYKRHRREKHSGRPKINCPYCEYADYRQCNVDAHIKRGCKAKHLLATRA